MTSDNNTSPGINGILTGGDVSLEDFYWSYLAYQSQAIHNSKIFAEECGVLTGDSTTSTTTAASPCSQCACVWGGGGETKGGGK